MQKIKIIFYCACVLVFSIFFTHNTEAYTLTKLDLENREDFVVEPGKTELFLNPGETVTRNISVTNRTNRKLEFNVDVENFIGGNDAQTAVVLLSPGEDTPYPLNEYVSFELDNFSLEFGEKMTFAVTITVPDNIEPGGHYGAIIISNKSSGDVSGSGNEVRGGTQLTSRIGSLILMRINGDVNESGNLESFKISGPNQFIRQKMPTTFEIIFQNDGSVHLVPYGEIMIRNIFGASIAQIPVDAYFSLPSSKRYQTISWPGKKFAFGFYTAELDLYKGYEQQMDNNKIRFVVFPFIVVIPAILIFILIVLILRFVSSRFEFKRK